MFKTVICAVGPGSRERAKRFVKMSQELLDPDGTLHLVHAVERFSSLSATVTDLWGTEAIDVANDELSKLASDLPERPIIHVRVGRPHQVILSVAKEIGADLIVVAANHKDVLEKVFGSVVDHVSRHADCSVHIYREKPERDR